MSPRILALGATALLLVTSPGPAQWRAQYDGRAHVMLMHQTTLRGGTALGATSWLAGAVTHNGAERALSAHVMLSLDPLIQGECGYPRLLTDAEICFPEAFEDRSWRDPFFMGLGLGVRQQLRSSTALDLKVELVGEPAFGPALYLLRASAVGDAIAPLSHHLFNPLHSVQGVITTALKTDAWQTELSLFNADGEDDREYSIRLAPLRSYSGRMSYQLSPGLRAQVSAGVLQASSGAAHHGAGGTSRVYSATVERSAGGRHFTFGWAAHRATGLTAHGFLAEAQLARGAHTLFARAEAGDRVEEQTEIIEHEDGTHEHIVDLRRLRVAELATAYTLSLPAVWKVKGSLGGRASGTTIPSFLRDLYAESTGFSFVLFTSIRPRDGSSHSH